MPPELPNDRILIGRIRNDSLRTVNLKSKQIRVLADEREVFGFGRFVDTFVHGNYPWSSSPVRTSRSRRRVASGTR